MLSTTLISTLLLSLLPSATLAHPTGQVKEYKALGCPNTTKPHAYQSEQLEALTTFSNKVFVEHNLTYGYGTFAAVNFINHAPEISGNGTAIAIATQGPMLAGGTVELQRIFVGKDVNGVSYGTVHFKGNSVRLGVGVIAGIWRMIGTCGVEYWDVATGVTNSSNPIAYF